MHHPRHVYASDWETWCQVPADGDVPAHSATEEELLARGVVVIGRDAESGEVWIRCMHVAGMPDPDTLYPGTAVAAVEGPRAHLAAQMLDMPQAAQRRCVRARVYRASGGAAPRLVGIDPDLIREHRAERAERGAPSRIAAVLVPLAEIEPNDVVEQLWLPPPAFAGETVATDAA